MALEALKFLIEDESVPKTRIRVFGVGGGGSNAVARMLNEGLSGVEFCVLNTDVQALAASPVPAQLAIGSKVTHGLGAGSDPAVGRQAALEDTEKIIELLEGADVVFVTAGLGGGTGTGAAPVVASLAKELGALTVAVVTKPFGFEGAKRRKQAEQGLADLASMADTVITIPNDQLLDLAPKGTSFIEAFRIADDVLRQAVQGISDIITTPGLINRDFSDVRNIMLGMGYAMMGTASARGENACLEAARKAITCPLMEAGGVRGARGVLINITASSRLGLHEVNDACTLIRESAANDDVQLNFGVVVNEMMDDEVKITVIATGFERENLPAIDRSTRSSSSLESLAPFVVPPTPQMKLPEPAPLSAVPLPQPELLASEPARLGISDRQSELAELDYAAQQLFDEEETETAVTEPEIEEEPVEEPMAMHAAANGAAHSREAFDDIDVPAILRRDRRMLQ